MAMIGTGMGATGETAVTGSPPTMGKLDQFMAGAKTWMSPSQIPDALRAVVSMEAWRAAPMALVGLLAVPAVLLAVVMGMGAAKRRRTRNPRRRRVAVRRGRRRAANRKSVV